MSASWLHRVQTMEFINNKSNIITIHIHTPVFELHVHPTRVFNYFLIMILKFQKSKMGRKNICTCTNITENGLRRAKNSVHANVSHKQKVS